MIHLDPTAFGFGRKRKAWAKIAGVRNSQAKIIHPWFWCLPSFFVRSITFLHLQNSPNFSWNDVLLSPISFELKLLDTYPMAPAPYCWGRWCRAATVHHSTCILSTMIITLYPICIIYGNLITYFRNWLTRNWRRNGRLSYFVYDERR